MAKKTSMSATSLTQVKPSQLVKFLQNQRRSKTTVMIWGAPGIGKSSLVRDYADSIYGIRNGKQVQYRLVDIRLAQMEPTDLRGIPIPVTISDPDLAKMAGVKEGTTVMVKWASPEMWPTENDAPTVIFLDEMNSAQQTIQAAAYQILLDRGIGELRFPEDTIIVAAGNRETDRGVTFSLPTPVRNRVAHVELIFDFEEWRTIATNKNYHALVIGYLSKFTDATDEFDPTSSENAFATPRTWQFVSDSLNANPDLLDDPISLGIDVASKVGTKHAIPFVAHVKDANRIPAPEDIFTGKIKKIGEKLDVGIQWTLVTMLIQALRKIPDNEKIDAKTKNKYGENFLQFVTVNFSKEYNILVARTAMKDKIIADGFVWRDMQIMTDWANEYGPYIRG
jgi:hypothetical protein